MNRDKKGLYNYLKKYHTGSENAVACKQLQMKFKLTRPAVKGCVSALRKEGIPICSNNCGYFYPATHLDVVDTVTRFNKYMLSLSVTSARLLSGKVKG